MDHFLYKCRVCRNDSIDCVDMDSPFGDTSPLTVMECFNICTSMDASQSDGLPNHICDICNDELKVSYNFILKAKESDDLLKKELSYINITGPDSEVGHGTEQKDDDDSTIGLDEDMEYDFKIKDENEKEYFTIQSATHEPIDDDETFWDDHIETAVAQLTDDYSPDSMSIKEEKVDDPDYKPAADSSTDVDDVIRDADKSKVVFVYKGVTIQKKGKADSTVGVKKVKATTSSSLQSESKSKNVLYVDEVVEVTKSPRSKTQRRRKSQTSTMISHHDKQKRAEFVKQVMEMNKDSDDLEKDGQSADSQNPKPGYIFPCNLCNKSFKEKGHLSYHIKFVHLKVRDYLCTLCPKMYPAKLRLEEHMRTHTGERPFKCSYCPKGFTKKTTLQNHERCHKDDLPFVCPECGKGFKQNSTLRGHMFVHTRVGIPCTICDKQFPRKVDLRKHMIIHSGDKPFKCDLCQRCYPYKANLNHHMKSHSFEDVYCPHCNIQINSLEEWKTHSQEHSEEYQCTECAQIFANKNAYLIHLKNQHELIVGEEVQEIEMLE